MPNKGMKGYCTPACGKADFFIGVASGLRKANPFWTFGILLPYYVNLRSPYIGRG